MLFLPDAPSDQFIANKRPSNDSLTPAHPPSRTPGLSIPQKFQLSVELAESCPGRCLIVDKDEPGARFLPTAGPTSLLRNQDARAVRQRPSFSPGQHRWTLFAYDRQVIAWLIRLYPPTSRRKFQMCPSA